MLLRLWSGLAGGGMEGQEEMKVRDRFDKNRIGDLVCDGAFKYVQNFAVEINGKRVAEYDSLDGVVEDWEDYTPAEPLIKDKKIRKAVRFKSEALAGAIEQSVKEFIDDIAELCGEEAE